MESKDVRKLATKVFAVSLIGLAVAQSANAESYSDCSYYGNGAFCSNGNVSYYGNGAFTPNGNESYYGNGAFTPNGNCSYYGNGQFCS